MLATLHSASEEDLLTTEFWTRQFPKLSINGYFASKQFSPAKLSAPLLAECQEKIMEEGYFQQHDAELKRLVLPMGEAVKRCVSLGLPPTFLFVFDQAWACFYRHHALLTYLLGNGYSILPDFWVWHVDPQRQEAGWTPHRDKGRVSLAKDGSPLSLTMWIPLSEATPLNGCMYMLPANRDPDYNTDREHSKGRNFALPDIRALPAKPGDYFCWNQAVLHWGAKTSRFTEAPRLSMALEFQRGDIQPFNTPLISPLSDLPFAARLKLVAKQILQYEHMYALAPEMRNLAQIIARV